MSAPVANPETNPLLALCEAFAESPLGAQALPITSAVDFSSTPRILDVLLALGTIAGLFGVGALIRSSGAKALSPAVFTSGVLAVLFFTLVDPIFWQLASVTATNKGLEVAKYSASDVELAWKDVEHVRLEEGSAFPLFSDDGRIVVQGKDGTIVEIPRFLPEAPALAAAVARKAPRSAASP